MNNESSINKGTVVIMRSAPGGGKSTYVKTHLSDGVICSADDYHYVNGVYCWDPKNVHKAHKTCQEKFLKALEDDQKLVVVDNTNIKVKDFTFYYYKALDFGYNVRIVRMNAPLKTLIGRNVHDVPDDIVERMFKAIEPIPSQWRIRELLIECL